MEIMSTLGSFPALSAEILPANHVILKITAAVSNACPTLSDCIEAQTLANALANSDKCPGTPEQGQAAERYVCIYPFTFNNLVQFELYGNSRSQFSADWFLNGTVNQGQTTLDAPWAYTQPSTAAFRDSAADVEVVREQKAGK